MPGGGTDSRPTGSWAFFFFVGSCVNDFSVMKIKAMQKCFELSWELVSSCKIIEIYNAG